MDGDTSATTSGEDRPVVLTGAAGFIGSHVAAALLASGRRVVGVDNFDAFYEESAKRENLAAVESGSGGKRFAFERADICDGGAMRALFERERPGGVVHLAALAGVRPSIAAPARYARVNVEGTATLLEASRTLGDGPAFVLASSSSVYGDSAKTPFAESDAACEPVSPYAATKRAAELIAHAHHALHGAPVACLRFFTVFGPRQRPDLAIAKFMRLIAAGEPIPMFGDGASSRDYTYIDDIVSGVVAALDRIPRHGHRVWNLGGSDPVSLAAMIDAVAQVVGAPAKIERRAAQPGDVGHTFADLSRSGAELGFRPRTSFREGLERQWAWMKTRGARRA